MQITSIGQIAVAVSDIDRAQNFYQDTLGLSFLFAAPPGLAFFDCNGTRLMLTTLNGDIKDHHTSVIYYKVEDLDTAVRHLRSQNIDFEQEPQLVAQMPDHDLWMGFIRDPDSNLIGIMAELASTK